MLETAKEKEPKDEEEKAGDHNEVSDSVISLLK
jgi:hypothetical protein